jgi:hypothetical protein
MNAKADLPTPSRMTERRFETQTTDYTEPRQWHMHFVVRCAVYRFRPQFIAAIIPPMNSPMPNRNKIVLVGCPTVVVKPTPVKNHPATTVNSEIPIFIGRVIDVNKSLVCPRHCAQRLAIGSEPD